MLAEGWEEMECGIEIFHVTLVVQVEFLYDSERNSRDSVSIFISHQ
jgi:hypothetical protein